MACLAGGGDRRGHDVVIVARRTARYPLQIAAWLGADEAFSELVAFPFNP